MKKLLLFITFLFFTQTSDAQDINWVEKFNLTFVSNTEVNELKSKNDNQLIDLIGKRNFSNWLVDVIPYEIIKINLDSSIDLSQPYSEPQYIQQYTNLSFTYHFTIPNLGDFTLINPIDTTGNQKIPSINKNPERWSFIDLDTINRILRKNKAKKMEKTIVFIENQVYLLLKDSSKKWLLRLTDGTLYRPDRQIIATKDSSDNILNKQLGNSILKLWTDSVKSEFIQQNFLKGKDEITYLFKYYFQIPDAGVVYCSIGFDTWGNLCGGFNWDKLPKCAENLDLCNLITKKEAHTIVYDTYRETLPDTNFSFMLNEKGFVWIIWYERDAKKHIKTINANSGKIIEEQEE